MKFFEDPIFWIKSNDPEYPYKTNFNGVHMSLRMNDFPEARLYTLIVEGIIIESFDEWPPTWGRG